MHRTIQVQTSEFQDYLDSSNQFYQDLIGYKPKQTSLQSISKSQWNEFAKIRGLNPNSSGIYLPRNQTAIIPKENPLSLFHEYFGHGLYCEQSLSGRRLVDLEKELLKEEKQEFRDGRFSLKDVQKFRDENKTFQELEKFRKQNLGAYELFAIWTEYLFSEEFNLREMFERKYGKLSSKDREQVDRIINFSEQYGNLATFYESGLARRTTPKRVRKLLEEIYGDKLQKIKLALLYGSRKEFSDIDVFVVGNLPKIKNDWIDISVYNINDVKEKLRLFDVALTDALSSGELVLGDEKYFVQQRLELERQLITEKAIKHNLREANKQERFAYQYPKESEERKIGLSYSQTSRLMAKNLKEGKRKLTKDTLISSSSNSIELKGGNK
ncbi:nucleotidyltransferase domain-containing protein [Candidatus Pacearchaeota archaeon]|nr:nucleotidyltransferase domain-containing protein [Candidatus Pacearchaeota archaeon]